MSKTLFRITTIPLALKALIGGQPKYMKEHGYRVIMVSSDGPERKQVMEDEQCEHIIVPMTRKITPIQDLKCFFQLRRIFKKYKPDIVHTHTPKAGLLGMMAARSTGVKLRVHTIAGLPVLLERGLKRRLLFLTERITYSCATNIWPNSSSIQKFILEKRMVKKEKINFINHGSSNGVDLKKYSASSLDPSMLESVKNLLPTGKFRLLFVGRIVKDKGIQELIDVFIGLQKKYPITLTLLGPYEHELDRLDEQTIRIISSNPGILHIDWTEQVEYFMALSDILVHPSHREGFPNVVLQAGAMKLPVVCSDIPGNTDIIENDSVGLLFKVGNADRLFECLNFSLENPGEMRLRADKLYLNVASSFDRQVVQKAILDQYALLENQ